MEESTNLALTRLMAAHRLRRADVARLLGGKTTVRTVDKWLLPASSPSWRRLPESKLELIRLKLGAGGKG
jgi:hypothetical protein